MARHVLEGYPRRDGPPHVFPGRDDKRRVGGDDTLTSTVWGARELTGLELGLQGFSA